VVRAGDSGRIYVICPHAAPRRLIGYVSLALAVEQCVAPPEVTQRRWGFMHGMGL
jgi:hypothetical protein